MIEEAKADYYSAFVAQCTGDQKSLFRVVDNLLHKSKEPVLPTFSLTKPFPTGNVSISLVKLIKYVVNLIVIVR